MTCFIQAMLASLHVLYASIPCKQMPSTLHEEGVRSEAWRTLPVLLAIVVLLTPTTVTQRRAWERDECSFMLVAAVARFLCPSLKACEQARRHVNIKCSRTQPIQFYAFKYVSNDFTLLRITSAHVNIGKSLFISLIGKLCTRKTGDCAEQSPKPFYHRILTNPSRIASESKF